MLVRLEWSDLEHARIAKVILPVDADVTKFMGDRIVKFVVLVNWPDQVHIRSDIFWVEANGFLENRLVLFFRP